MTPRLAYRRLYARLGPQGWWPTASVYHPRRYGAPPPREAFEVCVGAILTQNTAWTNVEKALASLRAARAVEPGRLARLPLRSLQRLIRSSGYFRQKAGRLRAFARWARGAGALAGRLRREPLPALREELLSLDGVGPETADSMLLYAGDRPSFVVDAYTRRIGSRVGWFRKAAAYDDIKGFFEAGLEAAPALYNEFHALLVRLAKDHCRTTPACGGCPLKADCRTGRKA